MKGRDHSWQEECILGTTVYSRNVSEKTQSNSLLRSLTVVIGFLRERLSSSYIVLDTEVREK